MQNLLIEHTYQRPRPINPKTLKLLQLFGLSLGRCDELNFHLRCNLPLSSHRLIYITGPSGCGKSTLLKLIRQNLPKDKTFNIDNIDMSDTRPIIERFDTDLFSTLKLLSKTGLSDLPALISPASQLSLGQRWRFQLALALASNKPFIIADEFCSNLDRITAATIAYNIRTFSNHNPDVTFILASSHSDILTDLSPDLIVQIDLTGNINLISRHTNQEKPPSQKPKKQHA